MISRDVKCHRYKNKVRRDSMLNKLERKIGKYAIRNLSMWLICAYIIGYVLEMMGSYNETVASLINYMYLNPYLILHGQVWRLITWIFIPPSSLDIFTIIMLFFYYSLGTTLERAWGTFRYNVYIFGGILMTLIGSFIVAGVYAVMGNQMDMYISGYYFTTYYINMSIFLAFAWSFPDMQVMLYFIIPIKIKWMAYFDIAYLAYCFFVGNWSIRVVILCSLMNFFIFFLTTRNYRRMSPKEIKRKREFKKQVITPKMGGKHRCTICGRTEEDDENLVFRYCSKCEGNYEYCQDHLYTHLHVKR